MKKYFFTWWFANLFVCTIHAQTFRPFNSNRPVNGYYRMENGKAGVMSKKGKMYLPAIYDAVSDIQEGTIRVELNGKTAFVDTFNRLVIPFDYDIDTLFFTNNRHLQTVLSVDDKGNETSGELVYTHARSYYNGFWYGLCAVVKNGKYGFISRENKTVIPFDYEAADNFRNDAYAIVMKNGKQGLINKTGQVVLPFIYDDVFWNEELPESNGELLIFLNGKRQYLKIPKQ